MKILITILVGMMVASVSYPSIAQCDTPQHRQFDFWLGQWQVTNGQNNNVSRSSITRINEGCSLLEEYTTPSGYQGKSLNMYDASTGFWHQTWMDNGGVLLQLDGKFEQGEMTLTGTTYNAKGKEVVNKIIWTPNTDGTVRQQWMVSNDLGKSWQSIFDGMYKKLP